MEHQRLTSLTTKRDLSLGGSKPKKIYKPNLNVVRNKDKSKEMMKVAQGPGQDRKRQRYNNRNNHKKEHPKHIQVSGTFSQGFGPMDRKQSSGVERIYTKDSGDLQSSGPTIRKKWDFESMESEKREYEPLINKEDVSSEDEGEYQPIRLPLYTNTESFLKSYRQKPDILKDQRLKSEYEKSSKMNTFNEDNRNGFKLVDNPFGSIKYNIYDDEHPRISLVKLPTSLSGKGFDENDKKVDYNLSHMVEGKIGTVKVRQSGKAEAHIGNMVYLLESVPDNSFKEQLVYVPNDLKLSFGRDVSTLGNIKDKYLLLPCWDDLFERKSSLPPQKNKTDSS